MLVVVVWCCLKVLTTSGQRPFMFTLHRAHRFWGWSLLYLCMWVNDFSYPYPDLSGVPWSKAWVEALKWRRVPIKIIGYFFSFFQVDILKLQTKSTKPKILIKEFGLDGYTWLYSKWTTNKDPLHSTGDPAQSHTAAWRGREGSLGQCLQQMMLGKLYIHMQQQKKEAGSLPHTTYKELTQNGLKI